MVKRTLSNIIDLLIYAIVFFLLFKSSRLEVNEINARYFYFASFLLVFFLPILVIKNTVGKILLKVHWDDQDNRIRMKLCAKYFIYFAILSPTFTFVGFFRNFPLLNHQVPDSGLIGLILFPIVLLTCDLIFFLASWGKFHITDYILLIRLKSRPFNRKWWITLGYVYFLAGCFILCSAFSYKMNLSTKSLTEKLTSNLFKEQYCQDQFFGNQVWVIRNNYSHVFTISDPWSFIYKRNLEQKTLYLNVPEHVFNSVEERKEVCYNLLSQSMLNDAFNSYHPQQTRIVLSYTEKGSFVEYYNYFYFYYFDNSIPHWGINGGVKGDSTTANDYINLVSKLHSDRVSSVEQRTGMEWSEIVKKSAEDTVFSKQIDSYFMGVSLDGAIYPNTFELKLDSSKIIFHKIKFEDSPKYGFLQINFPIQDLQFRANISNLWTGKLIEYDENVDYLMFIRNLVTDKSL